MRVLHLGKFYPPVRGGMETALQALCEGEQGRVATQALVAHTRPVTVRERLNGVPVTRVARLGTVRSLPICPTLPRWFAWTPADLVVLHEPNPFGLLAYLVNRRRPPLVVWFHSEVVRQRWLGRLYRRLLDGALRDAARVVVTSPSFARRAAALQGVRNKCVVVPFGIALERFAGSRPVDRLAELRNAYPHGFVLFVGRLVPYKGLEVLLEAMCGLKSRGSLVIVGTGPLEGRLQRQCQRLGLGDRVRFAGDVPTEMLLDLYHGCEVFVLPSTGANETFGIVQIEAMACGKPVVSTDLPTGVPWVNRHGETGLVVPPADAPALRDALDTLFADARLREVLGKQAQLRVHEEFTQAAMVERMVRLYEEILC